MWITIAEWAVAIIDWVYFILVLFGIHSVSTLDRIPFKNKTSEQIRIVKRIHVVRFIFECTSFTFWEGLRFYFFSESVTVTIVGWGKSLIALM
ncbi:hypothetical protein [Gracilibacillus sp. YIM 98692]|uniref:hypothetical protein n=1 Tax=Gracilibacillus sp. YIM 98692 TaxID=2663532 RepID=UPI001969B789|nr:hypothetical protein [Gracilibacillus sp. YIM 98692]